MTFDEMGALYELSADQAEVLGSLTVDLGALAKTVRKDEERIRLFLLAVARKEAMYAAQVAFLATQNLADAKVLANEAREFSNDAAILIRDWITVGLTAWKKLSFARLFGWDPFRELRQRCREFSARWELDPAVRAALG
jgi:hypothetical protein